MQSKIIRITTVLFLLATVGGLFWYNQYQTTKKSSKFVYGDFVNRYPIFGKEITENKENIRQIAMELEKTVATMEDAPQTVSYARYLVVRAYVNAVIADWNDQESLDKALAISSEIIGNNQEYPNIRAYTVALVDMLLYPSVKYEVRTKVIEHQYYSKFADSNDKTSVRKLRFNLLSFGNKLYRMTDIKYRLAILETQRLISIKRASPAMPATWESVRGYMADAEASLLRDQAGEMPFGNDSYLVESLYRRAEFAAVYYETTGEKPLGDIDTLYLDAITLSSQKLPKLTPIIEKSLDTYRNHQSDLK